VARGGRVRSETYIALAGFYAASRERRSSRERDIGLWWRAKKGFPSFRAAWVESTGEVYVVQHGPGPRGGEVSVIGRAPDRRSLERLVRGWREVCGQAGSLDWLLGRFRGPGSREVATSFEA